MRLNTFKARKVHGYLNYDLEFYPELTFLIGINGSGKTSALKLILGLISPSFQFLNQIDYDYAELICSSNNNELDIKIIARQSKQDNTFTLILESKDKTFQPGIFNRYIKPSIRDIDNEDISVIEQSLREQFDVHETVSAIRGFATPKFLGLDRKIYEGINIDNKFRNRRYHNLLLKQKKGYLDSENGVSAIDGSLEDVQTLIYEYFRQIAYKQPVISEEFKRKVLQLSFKFTDDSSLGMIPEDNSSLLEKKNQVLDAIKNLDINFLNNQANSFFDQMSDLITENLKIKQSHDLLKATRPVNAPDMKALMKWINNSSQMKRIDEIINYSQNYQAKLAELRSPIKRLEDIATNFLKEGKKQIKISRDGEIKVKHGGYDLRSIYELSSGEKQIIIMIAHLIFEEDQKPSGVFIIDEPELSLHIAWQEIFVDSIMEASPKTQFILATHAPSIISKAKREVYCQDLNKLNS
jgi:predicted ATP-dependent endonuclease of OLD family